MIVWILAGIGLILVIIAYLLWLRESVLSDINTWEK